MTLVRRVAGSLRARLGVMVTTLRERPRSAAAAVVAFVVRWSLRIGLPLAGAAAMLTLFPYHAVAGGAHFLVQGTLLTRRGLSADTTFGSWVFPHVDGLPAGVHVTPVNVDLVRIASAASSKPAAVCRETSRRLGRPVARDHRVADRRGAHRGVVGWAPRLR